MSGTLSKLPLTAFLLLSIVAASCSGSDSNVQNATSTGSFADPVEVASLEQSFLSFISCLEADVDGSARANFDRYTGFALDFIHFEGDESGERTNAFVDGCADDSLLDERLSEFGSSFIAPVEMIVEISGELSTCYDSDGREAPSELTEARTADDLAELEAIVLSAASSVEFRDCFQSALTGPRIDF